MDLSIQVANMATSMKAAEFAQNYAVALESKALDTMEMMGNEVLQMINSAAPVVKGEFIDVYA